MPTTKQSISLRCVIRPRLRGEKTKLIPSRHAVLATMLGLWKETDYNIGVKETLKGTLDGECDGRGPPETATAWVTLGIFTSSQQLGGEVWNEIRRRDSKGAGRDRYCSRVVSTSHAISLLLETRKTCRLLWQSFRDFPQSWKTKILG